MARKANKQNTPAGEDAQAPSGEQFSGEDIEFEPFMFNAGESTRVASVTASPAAEAPDDVRLESDGQMAEAAAAADADADFEPFFVGEATSPPSEAGDITGEPLELPTFLQSAEEQASQAALEQPAQPAVVEPVAEGTPE